MAFSLALNFAVNLIHLILEKSIVQCKQIKFLQSKLQTFQSKFCIKNIF